MRKLIREAAFGLTEIKSEEIWRCTTCGKCPQRCPRDVKQINNMIALRGMATGYGVFPATVKHLRAIWLPMATPSVGNGPSGLIGRRVSSLRGWKFYISPDRRG